jgi:hypothetical protein
MVGSHVGASHSHDRRDDRRKADARRDGRASEGVRWPGAELVKWNAPLTIVSGDSANGARSLAVKPECTRFVVTQNLILQPLSVRRCLNRPRSAITGPPRSARKVPGQYAGAICAFAASGRTKASMPGPARTKRTLVPQSFREGLIFGCRAEWWRRSGRGTMISRAELTDQSTC